MKRKFAIIIFLALYCTACFAQVTSGKRPLAFSDLGGWPAPGAPSISSDGKYIAFDVQTFSGPQITHSTLTLRSADGRWCVHFPGAKKITFMDDDRAALVGLGSDTLVIVKLGGTAVRYLSQVNSYQTTGDGEKATHVLAYLTQGVDSLLTLENVTTGRKLLFKQVSDYRFDPMNKYLVVLRQVSEGSLIILVDLKSTKKRTTPVKTISKLFFETGDKGILVLGVDHSVLFYPFDSDSAKVLVSDICSILPPEFKFTGLQSFDAASGRLIFSARKTAEDTPGRDSSSTVKIWSYNDPKLYPALMAGGQSHRTFAFEWSSNDHVLKRIEEDNDHLAGLKDDWALSRNYGDGETLERFWNRTAARRYFLISLKTGNRQELPGNPSFSLEGKYILWYDPENKNYFTEELASGITRNITQNIRTNWTVFGDDWVDAGSSSYTVGGWTADDQMVLLQDQHNLWLVDPKAETAPRNLTGDVHRQNCLFHLSSGHFGDQPFPLKKDLLLNAYDRDTKENGFFTVNLSQKHGLRELTMGPYVYQQMADYTSWTGMPPAVAANAKAYVVQRMSASSAPNLYYTRDFNTFAALTEFHPQAAVNWYSTELINWRLPNGQSNQGVLYKPENFDPGKKYPVIFYYYEQLSDLLNVFQPAALFTGPLNIPWFVSHGYLVFTPDIHYRTSHVAESVVNTIVSAAAYLTKLPFVDSMHMGVEGHSHGGYETNCILTHTSLFAAGCTASGVSDLISGYGTINYPSGTSFGSSVEYKQQRMGKMLWEAPGEYIANSPVFFLGHVTTPWLIMGTTQDDIVAFTQAEELFSELRRLGKKSWLLQYDDNHTLTEVNARDFTIRLEQFFDHYLKGVPAPEWLAGGDTEPNLLLPEEQKKADSLETRKPVTVIIP